MDVNLIIILIPVEPTETSQFKTNATVTGQKTIIFFPESIKW